MTLGDSIAQAVLSRFDALPARCKPLRHGEEDSDTGSEWVPLSGIVISNEDGGDDDKANFECVALATGMKCLPASKIPQANGCVLHDSHAEVLAMRAFNLFLLQQCHTLVTSGHCESEYLKRRPQHEICSNDSDFQPFALKSNIRIHMYCSEAPCGDASMELNMNAQEDATPWETPALTPLETKTSLHGRGYYSELGVVRRKPARADSPLTLSKSCSDKLAMKQCTSLLSCATSLLVQPQHVYLSNLVLPASQYVADACSRCFSSKGRLKQLVGEYWPGGRGFRPFEIQSTNIEFSLSRRIAGPKGSNISSVWTPESCETLINGVLQGRKQSDPRGASSVSRRQLLDRVFEVVRMVDSNPTYGAVLAAKRYSEVKSTFLLEGRRAIKRSVIESALQGWIPNEADDFSIPPNRGQ